MPKMPRQKPGRSKQNYGTPLNFLVAVKARLGIKEFVIDLAAEAANTKAGLYIDKDADALSYSHWANFTPEDMDWAWLNPEFADIDPWAEKCWRTKMHGGQVALLVPAGVGANWYRDYVHKKALVLALNGRLCFVDDWQHTIDPATLKPGKGPARCYASAPLYPKDCILCLYSPHFKPGFDVWSWRD